MKKYCLTFSNDIIQLERDEMWIDAADTMYQQWEMNPGEIHCLLCAGTQLWYTLCLLDSEMSLPLQMTGNDSTMESLEQKLWEIAQLGNTLFANDPAFNAYFGYMLSVQPIYFLQSGLDYLKLKKTGIEMIQRAYQIDPTSLFVQAVYYNSGCSGNQNLYRCICREIWKTITPEQWGSSEVNQYFFRILNGDQYSSKRLIT